MSKSEDSWVVETVNDPSGFRTALKAVGGLRTVDSAQSLGVFDNPTFGRVMVLDGAYQITTADEFIYHEMMAHVPAFAHGALRHVLVIGGGDGGVARELLRHPSIDTITLVEIDQAVVDLAKDHFPTVCQGAFDNPRLTVVIDDGAGFVANTDARFDAVIVDAPDPVGAGKVLFEAPFYAGCRRVLREGGILVTQSGIPFLTPDWMRDHAATLRQSFESVDFFLSTVPSYTGGPMAHSFCSDDPALANVSVDIIKERAATLNLTTRYWTPTLHGAAFALPRYVDELVAPPST